MRDKLVKVMETWAAHYGCEAGAMGLRTIPYGGLFLAGGMTPKNLEWLKVKFPCLSGLCYTPRENISESGGTVSVSTVNNTI